MNDQQSVVFSGQSDASLTVTVTTPVGCKATDILDITVHQGNFASLNPNSRDTGICPGEHIDLFASGGVFYDWTPGAYLTDSTSPNVTATPFTDVDYNLLVTDQFGCFDTLNYFIDVHPGALLELGDSINLWPGDSVLMDPQGNCLYFSWFPPLGLTADNIANPWAMPQVNTRYYVWGSTEWGCRALDSVDVFVHPESVIDVPNAFVPGNGPNGSLSAVHLGIATLEYFRIYDRWGVKVFETKDINEGWDGKLNGKPQPMGVYIYTIDGQTNLGHHVIKQGNITLIR